MDIASNRLFKTKRRVRVGDCDSTGTIRVDALARYLQDVGYDDTDDIGVGDGGFWVARSIDMDFSMSRAWPKRNEWVELETYCGGAGRAFAQRNVNIFSENKNMIRTSTIWVSVDESGKPMPVPQWLLDAYPDVERISAARTLSMPSFKDNFSGTKMDWQLRASDFDINDHVNNAVAFDAIYDIAHKVKAPLPQKVLIEYHHPIGIDSEIQLWTEKTAGGFLAWLLSGDKVAASMAWS